MLNCAQVTRICSDELERPLKLAEQVGLLTHLMMCSGCTNYRRQLATLRRAMRAYADGQAPSGDPADGRGAAGPRA